MIVVSVSDTPAVAGSPYLISFRRFLSVSGMGRTRSMTRNHNHDDEEASSSRKRPKTCAPWSDLDHNLLYIVMMQLGVIEFLSFRGVCKSWRSLACSHEKKFMASRPPMQMSISCRTNKKTCHLEDFDGRKFKTILPCSAVVECVGLTCGYLIFFTRKTRDFWLVNPITRKKLHFPNCPLNYNYISQAVRAILVFSPSISRLVFVVYYINKLWFSVEGNGAWNCVPHSFNMILDLCAFKGKIYILTYNLDTLHHLCELRLSPQPKLTLLKIKTCNPLVTQLASSAEKLYVIYPNYKVLHELHLGKMKWVVPREKTMEQYAFFCSDLNRDVVAVKRQSWADPRSQSLARFAISDDDGENTFFTDKMWYFPHQCMNVDRIDE